MFDDFGGLATGLTCLELSVKVSWLDGTNILHFPNLTVFNLRTTNPTRQPTSAPVTTLQLPKVEKSQLFLCDTRTINFVESYLPNLRDLRLFTPCYVKDWIGGKEGTWTRNNFLVEYQNLDHILIAVHGIERFAPPPVPVQWDGVKRVALAMDVEIADILGHVKMPMLEEITLIYPQWGIDRHDWHVEGWVRLRAGARMLVNMCYDKEVDELSAHFPGYVVTTHDKRD
jgi:hypothetical protein